MALPRTRWKLKIGSIKAPLIVVVALCFGTMMQMNPNPTSKAKRSQKLIVDDGVYGINRADWWLPHVDPMSRIYRMIGDETGSLDAGKVSNSSKYAWCRPLPTEKHENPYYIPTFGSLDGMIYIKTHKTASSTCEGIAESIAYKVGKRTGTDHRGCLRYTQHNMGNKNQHGRRSDYPKSIMWSFVRKPSSRDLSHVFYFHYTCGSFQNQTKADDQTVINKLRNRGRNYQTRYLITSVPRDNWTWPGPQEKEDANYLVELMKKEIMDNYQFIGVTERMSESLAVLTILFHLEARDVVTLSAKVSNGSNSYTTCGITKNVSHCFKIRPTEKSERVSEYIATEHGTGNLDMLLYAAVNKSLDRTIEAIGRERVEVRVAEIQGLQTIAEENCLPKAEFPCSSDGIKQVHKSSKSCHVVDSGCGHECIDKVLEDIKPEQ